MGPQSTSPTCRPCCLPGALGHASWRDIGKRQRPASRLLSTQRATVPLARPRRGSAAARLAAGTGCGGAAVRYALFQQPAQTGASRDLHACLRLSWETKSRLQFLTIRGSIGGCMIKLNMLRWRRPQERYATAGTVIDAIWMGREGTAGHQTLDSWQRLRVIQLACHPAVWTCVE